MPAWDRDHPQDVGSGLQSPATAERDGLRRKNNSPLLTCRRWEEPRQSGGSHTDTHGLNGFAQCTNVCVCECKEKHHWTYCYNHVGSHLHSTPMCSWGEGTYLQHGQEKPITPGKESSSNTSVYTSHTRTNNANTKALAPKQFQSLLFLLSVIQRGTSLHSSQDTMALSFISELMMFPGSIHWGPFNDTWMREGRHEGGEARWPAFYWE